MWAKSGMAMGPLPFAGGSAEQPAALMRCFMVLSGADQKLNPPKKGKGE